MNATDDIISQIPLEDLHDSPFNPRRDLTGLDDLAQSITAEGRIHEPLLVHPRMTDIVAKNPDDMFDGYEIVFGHRRAGAAAIAGLASAPCMVRSMTDSEVRSAQIAENLQRENVHALEEAESFRQLMEADSITADALALRLGKSRSHIYGRLKLNALCAEVRTACAAGEIGSEVALLVARLRTDKLQAKALQYIRAHNIEITDGGAQSYRRIRTLLNEKFATDLKGALFDPADATLLPDAGACTGCTKRTGNAPEYADVLTQNDGDKGQSAGYWMGRAPHAGANVCTDPDCFELKKRAHLKRQAEALQAKGKTVVDGNAARAAVSATGEVKGAYVALKDVKAQLKKPMKNVNGPAGKPLLHAMPATVLIQDPRTGKTVEAVKRSDLELAGAKVPAPKKHEDYREQEARRDAERKRNEERAAVERKVRAAVLEEVRDCMEDTERTAFDLRLIVGAMLASVDYQSRQQLVKICGGGTFEKLQQGVGKLDMKQLALLALDCALVDDLLVNSYALERKPITLLAAAAHYGVDVDQVRRQVAGEASVAVQEEEEAAA